MKSEIKKTVKGIIQKRRLSRCGVVCNSKDVSCNATFGKGVKIGKKVYIGEGVKVGDYSYVNSDYNYAYIESGTEIGKFCSLGPNISIGYGNHDYNRVSTHPFLYNEEYYKGTPYKLETNGETSKPDTTKTIIGNDVWIGANANIKAGVKIGNGAVVAMNAVVTKDVPDYAIVAGIPAKIIKYRFNDEEIRRLNKVSWWDMDMTELLKNNKHFQNIGAFLEKYDGGAHK